MGRIPCRCYTVTSVLFVPEWVVWRSRVPLRDASAQVFTLRTREGVPIEANRGGTPPVPGWG